MVAPAYQIERRLPDELCIRLSGELDEATLLACESDARGRLRLAKPGSLRMLWDLLEVTGYTLEARSVLAHLQGFLAEKADRTVYVARHSQARSLSLWAVHMAGARQARIADDLEHALGWLRGSGEPDTAVRPLVSVRPPAAVDPYDKTAS
ncbi:MAG TPA: hypothetical protein VF331_22275 [Polyangiales bacterium]